MGHRCIIDGCGKILNTPHHFKTRGSGGTDDAWNMMPLCLEHHSIAHSMGSYSFSQAYKEVREWLVNNGWQLNVFFKKWHHND